MRTPRVLAPEVSAYLERIGYDGATDCTIDVLSAIQERHLHSVPYENLDIVSGIPLSLEVPDLYDKIVVRRRGGYCFELNALFGWMLRELGFPVVDLFARFWRDEPNPPPKRRHHVLKVSAEGQTFLCDVGVGGIVPRRPVQLVERLVQPQGDEQYRLERREPTFGWMLCEWRDGKWRDLYSFTEEPQLPIDYIAASFWCEQAPESIFRKQPMVAMRTIDGRRTVAGTKFRLFTPAGVHEFEPESESERLEALHRYFGLRL